MVECLTCDAHCQPSCTLREVYAGPMLRAALAPRHSFNTSRVSTDDCTKTCLQALLWPSRRPLACLSAWSASSLIRRLSHVHPGSGRLPHGTTTVLHNLQRITPSTPFCQCSNTHRVAGLEGPAPAAMPVEDAKHGRIRAVPQVHRSDVRVFHSPPPPLRTTPAK